MKMYILLTLTMMALLADGAAAAPDNQALEIMNKSHLAYYYAGDGGHARVEMVLTDKKGRTREREFWMLRRDIEEMGDQRYYTFFLKPADVSRTAFLVHKNSAGSDDRWLYIPALDLVKRIAADDRGSSFVGSDFSYEDVSGRLPSLDDHETEGAETVLGRATTKVRNTPKDSGTADYAYRISWIDDQTFLPLKEEYYDKKGEAVRRFEVLAIEDVEGIPTAVKRTMADLKKGSKTDLSFSEMTYESRLEVGDFNERLLKNPPREYTQ